jgi:hypothetical protein
LPVGGEALTAAVGVSEEDDLDFLESEDQHRIFNQKVGMGVLHHGMDFLHDDLNVHFAHGLLLLLPLI